MSLFEKKTTLQKKIYAEKYQKIQRYFTSLKRYTKT